MNKTRWKITSDVVTIYPYRIFYLLSLLFAFVLGILLVYLRISTGLQDMVPVTLVFVVIILMLVAGGATKIVFDNERQLMQKKLFGILPVISVAFEKLEGITIVRNTLGGFNFRAFRKNNKYGKGIVVSSGYSKETDKNAQAFVNEVVPAVEAFLSKVRDVETVKAPILEYTFFSVNSTKYQVKKDVLFLSFIAVLFFAFAISELIHTRIMTEAPVIVKYALIAGSFLLGIGGIAGVFTKIIFDTSEKTIEVISPIGLGNRVYAFADYQGVQVVRKTTNGMHSGTEVQLYFQDPVKNKMRTLIVRSFRRPGKIEQFLDELHSIMGHR